MSFVPRLQPVTVSVMHCVFLIATDLLLVSSIPHPACDVVVLGELLCPISVFGVSKLVLSYAHPFLMRVRLRQYRKNTPR